MLAQVKISNLECIYKEGSVTTERMEIYEYIESQCRRSRRIHEKSKDKQTKKIGLVFTNRLLRGYHVRNTVFYFQISFGLHCGLMSYIY